MFTGQPELPRCHGRPIRGRKRGLLARCGYLPAAHLPAGFKCLYSSVTFRIALSMADSNTSRFGFVAFAETWNGRLAMLGFVIGLGTELLTGQGILGQLGLG